MLREAQLKLETVQWEVLALSFYFVGPLGLEIIGSDVLASSIDVAAIGSKRISDVGSLHCISF